MAFASPLHAVEVATASIGASVSEIAAVRACRTAVALASGNAIFPAMRGSIGVIATFSPVAGTGGSLALTVATRLMTANGDIASLDPYIASLAAFSGLCAALMRRHCNRCGNAVEGSDTSIPTSATPIARQALDRAIAVHEISQSAAGLGDTRQVSGRWS